MNRAKIIILISMMLLINLFLFKDEIRAIAGQVFTSYEDKLIEMKDLGIIVDKSVQIDKNVLVKLDFKKLKNKVKDFTGTEVPKIVLTNLENEDSKTKIEVKTEINGEAKYIQIDPDLDYEIIGFIDEAAYCFDSNKPEISMENAKKEALEFAQKHFRAFNKYNMVLVEQNYFNRVSKSDYYFIWKAVDENVELPVYVNIMVDSRSGKVCSYTCGYGNNKVEQLNPKISKNEALDILKNFLKTKYPDKEIKEYNIKLMVGENHTSKVKEDVLKYRVDYKFNVPEDAVFDKNGKYIVKGGSLQINANTGEIILEGIY
ncbi:hypothetical protein ciss_22690 [Carboxydothermus islandicus]|uniref:YcdB/YcdC repeated domain-containing protein n=1 Tax=Carboxydothermus islandicus TaxID=661089 RepID=A0A1L8D550_9THEO|nr:hypothetical protein [Carboxydothermus islandicus]GAV26336.1 hypothetical protein ciss_22690 [Carboxydothermus islandicus]